MKKKYSLIVDDEFVEYCRLNEINDIDKLAKETFNRGFSLLKYPQTPMSYKNEKIVEKEVIKELIKEVPIEKIVIKEVPVEKIVEIIKEVPIEVKGETQIITKEIIKEVPVEKLVTDDEEINKLKKENEELKKQLDEINKSLNKFNRATFMKNSDLNDLYSE